MLHASHPTLLLHAHAGSPARGAQGLLLGREPASPRGVPEGCVAGRTTEAQNRGFPLPAGLFQHGPDGAGRENAEEGPEAPQPALPLQHDLRAFPHPCGEKQTPSLLESTGQTERTTRVRGGAGRVGFSLPRGETPRRSGRLGGRAEGSHTVRALWGQQTSCCVPVWWKGRGLCGSLTRALTHSRRPRPQS